MAEDKTEVKPEPSLFDRSEAIAKRIEDANKRAEEILTKNEHALSRLILGGKSSVVPVPEAKVETPKEYAKRVMEGKGVK